MSTRAVVLAAAGASFVVEVDRDGDRAMFDGDDAVVASGWASGETLFADDFRWTCVVAGATAMCGVEDVDADAVLDLVLHFDTSALVLAAEATSAVLEGSAGGAPFRGEDSVRVVPR